MKINKKIILPVLVLLISITIPVFISFKNDISIYIHNRNIALEKEKIKIAEEEKLKQEIQVTKINLIKLVSTLTTDLVDGSFRKDVVIKSEDSWGTTFKVDFKSEERLQVKSAGPDKIFDTPDDLMEEGIKEVQSGIKYYLKSLIRK
jgi:alpha-N-acetylglucosamine transferase